MIRAVTRLAAVGVLAVGLLTACSEGTPACAATNPKPPPKPVQPRLPANTQRPQDRPAQPAQPRTTRTLPRSWGEYKPPHKWGQPYGKGRPAAPQPTVTRYRDQEVRIYPGYPGFYPVNVWPVGYGDTYGCVPFHEGQPVR